MEEVTYSELVEMYEDMLDDCYDVIKICGLEYSPSIALYRVDEVAYNCGLDDYISFLISDDTIVEEEGKYYRPE